MPIESNGARTANGDNAIIPNPNNNYKYKVDSQKASPSNGLESSTDNTESSIFRNAESLSANESSLRDLSLRSNPRRYLSVPPLTANLYAFPKIMESHSSSSEFQALHPKRDGSSQFEGRASKRSISPTSKIDRPEDVIDISYHPDPYRVIRQSNEKTTAALTSLDDPSKAKPSDQTAKPLETSKPLDLANIHARPRANNSSDAILGASYKYLNTKPWQNSPYSQYVDKSQAGPSSVSAILKEQGFDYANSGTTANLSKKLMVNGWQLVQKSKGQPGDIIFGGKLGGNWKTDRGMADIGVLGTNDQVFHNDPSTGEWQLNKQSRVFPKNLYGDQVWVLRAPEQVQNLDKQTTNSDQTNFLKFERDINPNDLPIANQYHCGKNCHYFDAFAKLHEGQPKSYYSTNEEAAQAGARDGKRAYEETRRQNPSSKKSEFKGYRYDGTDSQNSKDKNLENPNKYWSDYWKTYWKDYYSKNTDGTDNRQNPNNSTSKDYGSSIHEAAKGKIGQSVWQTSPHANILEEGRLGSASSVGQILQSLGYSYANSPGVALLAKQLLSGGWTPVKLSELRPGDVIYGAKNAQWEQGGGNSHMAIVGKDGHVLHNDSSTGKFQEDKVGDVYDKATYGNRIWALRPPADGPQSKPAIHKRGSDYNDGPYEYEKPNDSTNNTLRDGAKGSKNIVNAALTSVGKQMYRPMLSYAMGRLGCAASVSGVLQKAGFKYAKHAGVFGLTQQLQKNGWTKHPVSEAKPGDVVYGIRSSSWKNGGGGSHIGVVGEGNTSYHNSSAKRHWIQDTLSTWNTNRYRLGVYVLRPPSA